MELETTKNIKIGLPLSAIEENLLSLKKGVKECDGEEALSSAISLFRASEIAFYTNKISIEKLEQLEEDAAREARKFYQTCTCSKK